ncbi:MAG: sensor histidine kinase, partial [Burkholderiales bacterium]|nr:sensor histidine kinase [Burkholderiales bacterium]
YEQIEREREALIENRARQSLFSWLWSKVTDDAPSSELYRASRSWMAVPLRYREDVLGVMRVDHQEPDYFDPERARLLNAVSSQTALAMRHARLQAQQREVAVIAERNRIARDLHDAVSQTLFAANVLAGTLARSFQREPAPEAASVAAQAQALERLNRGALAEMRLLMFELRPDALHTTPLAELLQHAIEALACRGDIAIESALAPQDALAPEVRVQLYRIAQEALSNVARHSGALHCRVEWTPTGKRSALLRIADDGTGFNPEAARPGHFGVENMRGRALEIGAKLTLTSAPGEGTELRVEWNPPSP